MAPKIVVLALTFLSLATASTPTKLRSNPGESFSTTVFNAKPADGPWQDYNIAPKSRTVHPKSIYSSSGIIIDPEAVLSSGPTQLVGEGSSITFDFGVNTAGIVTIDFGPGPDSGQVVGVSFTESKQFIGRDSDKSTDFGTNDGFIRIEVEQDTGKWKMPEAQQRGGFRYMTVFMETGGVVELKGVEVWNNFMPKWDDLRDYKGFFYSSDDFLNTIWYAGAYTVQLNTIPTDTGRAHDYIIPREGWSNDKQCGVGEQVLTDGSKRDRTVWSGDRGITTLTEYIALNNGIASKNGVDWLFLQQIPETGELPYAAPPIDEWGSDTYHLWTVIALYNSYFYGGDETSWAANLWPGCKRAIEFSLQKIDDNGLMLVDLVLDWGRVGMGGHNLAANCLLYSALQKASEFANIFGEPDLATEWLQTAESIKVAVNTILWDEEHGLYTDNATTTLHPQDGNSMAIWYGLVDTPAKATRISDGLPQYWNEFGAVAPESPQMISPFISSMELIAHFLANKPRRAMELIHLMWGYMWNAPYSVQSSLIEGYYHTGECKYPFLAYDPSYISHAHPWGSGPTVVSTFYILGLQLLSADHRKWSFIPYADIDMEFAMGGITSDNVGFFSAGWKKRMESLFEMAINSPPGTSGTIGVPTFGKEGFSVFLDGELVETVTERENATMAVPVWGGMEDKQKILSEHDIHPAHVFIEGVVGGNHTVLVVYS